MTQAQAPEALRLAGLLSRSSAEHDLFRKAAAELRRQHAHIAQLEAELAQLRQASKPAPLTHEQLNYQS